MTHSLAGRRVRPRPAAALATAIALLELAAPNQAAAAAARAPDASYLAHGPAGLHVALTIHDGRLRAYACDGASRKAYFSGRARRGRLALRNRDGDRLALRLRARGVAARLTLNGAAPTALTARRARAAIYRVTVRPDGAAFGTAPGGGVLGAHLSRAGLVGALGYSGLKLRAFREPDFAHAPLFVDGRPVPYPPDRAAEALQGRWRWIVTPTRIVGATTRSLNINTELRIAAGTKFVSQAIDWGIPGQ